MQSKNRPHADRQMCLSRRVEATHKLSMYISTHCHWTSDWLYVRLLHQDFASLRDGGLMNRPGELRDGRHEIEAK